MVQALEFGTKYEKTKYEVPFGAIDMSRIVHALMEGKHDAFEKERTEKFSPSEFPEFDFGETDEQPSFATVIADYSNFIYATTLHNTVSELQKDGIIEFTLGDNGFQYFATGEIEDEELDGIVNDANIFL